MTPRPDHLRPVPVARTSRPRDTGLATHTGKRGDRVADDPRLRRLLDGLPEPVRRSYAWLEQPRARWLRLPLGLLLIVCGVFGFLPVVGFWMLPVGALLIGVDIPFVRTLTLAAIARAQRWWDAR